MTAYGSYGALIKRGATTIGQVVSINGFQMTKEFLDSSHLTSTSRYRTFISQFRDAGTVDVEVLFDPVLASHELVEDDFNADTTTAWSIVFPDAAPTTWSCDAGVSDISPAMAVGDMLKMQFSLKLSGVPTLD